MTINEFIEDCASYDSPIGDLANDILEDKNFPSKKSDREILEYLDTQTRRGGTNDTFQEFLAEYRKKTNKTLGLILNYLKENKITSIEIAMEKKIAMSYVETCGYLIKIPVTEFPKTVIKDMEELATMNEKYVPISDGKEVQSHLLSKPNMNDGMNITFCSQEVQFEFLLSLNEEK